MTRIMMHPKAMKSGMTILTPAFAAASSARTVRRLRALRFLRDKYGPAYRAIPIFECGTQAPLEVQLVENI